MNSVLNEYLADPVVDARAYIESSTRHEIAEIWDELVRNSILIMHLPLEQGEGFSTNYLEAIDNLRDLKAIEFLNDAIRQYDTVADILDNLELDDNEMAQYAKQWVQQRIGRLSQARHNVARYMVPKTENNVIRAAPTIHRKIRQ